LAAVSRQFAALTQLAVGSHQLAVGSPNPVGSRQVAVGSSSPVGSPNPVGSWQSSVGSPNPVGSRQLAVGSSQGFRVRWRPTSMAEISWLSLIQRRPISPSIYPISMPIIPEILQHLIQLCAQRHSALPHLQVLKRHTSHYLLVCSRQPSVGSNCKLHTANCKLRVGSWQSSVGSNSKVPAANCLLQTAYCILPTANS
jgi:hypothetical protein